jgi:acetate kinase
MPQLVLTLNVGSSSLKIAGFAIPDGQRLLDGGIDRIGAGLALRDLSSGREVKLDTPSSNIADCLPTVADAIQRHGHGIGAIAHRVVHGGWIYSDHAKLDNGMLSELGKLVALAPNHLPAEIDFMAAALKHFPDIPQFACFDTVFHHDLPNTARTLALPRRLKDQGVRRYGFHGLSYTYLMSKLPEHIGERANGRIILAHLGSGASLAAVRRGKPVDTTMGLTPLGGLVMATRCGDIDPGLPLFLQRSQGVSPEVFEHMAYAESGMLGISGSSGDVRDLLKAEANDPAAAEALSLFCYQARKHIAAMAAALEGVDVIVFSGGIGSNSVQIRQRICEDLEWLGLTLDPQANAGGEPCISAPASKVMAFALPTDEEAVMAEIVFRRMQASGNPG